ncbi:tetratricopeptide repeat protein [candidate division KSB1 bacterium]|nr:tetratricopeptide repeat protein [candidate division KSB1 bacterium]
MDPSYILVIVLLLVIIGTVSFFIRYQQRGTRRVITDDYTEGLRLLLLGEKKKALEKLRLAAIKDTNNIDAYIKIGELLRESGQTDKAIKIHNQLTVRRDLTKEERIDIYKSLIRDYGAATKYDKGLEFIELLLQLDKNNDWALNKKLLFYESAADWQKAFETKQKILKTAGEKDDALLALYKVQKGLALAREGETSDAQDAYQEALKLNPLCVPAYLYRADACIREKKQKDALNLLMKFIDNIPEKAHLAFDRLRQLLFDMGNFSQLETIYQSVQAKNPDSFQSYLALAKLYEGKGDFNEALDLALRALEKKPDSVSSRAKVIKYYNKLGRQEKAIQYALSWIDSLDIGHNHYVCVRCGFQSSEPLWYCPNCRNWNSFEV